MDQILFLIAGAVGGYYLRRNEQPNITRFVFRTNEADKDLRKRNKALRVSLTEANAKLAELETELYKRNTDLLATVEKLNKAKALDVKGGGTIEDKQKLYEEFARLKTIACLNMPCITNKDRKDIDIVVAKFDKFFKDLVSATGKTISTLKKEPLKGLEGKQPIREEFYKLRMFTRQNVTANKIGEVDRLFDEFFRNFLE